jgi:2-amino-4-hydroxy-6-hydroxymethyldihydropteridine diphosphokinase
LELILLNNNITPMKEAFLGLGSNLGNREEILSKAIKMIGESLGKIVSVSSLYETEPWGFKSNLKFLNMVLCIETKYTPSGLIGRILMIESQLGRVRCESQNSSRTIDIDILLFDDDIIEEDTLTIPHPRMHERKFVLVPLCEIAPEVVHPVLKKKVNELLEDCNDTSKVTLLDKIQIN